MAFIVTVVLPIHSAKNYLNSINEDHSYEGKEGVNLGRDTILHACGIRSDGY